MPKLAQLFTQYGPQATTRAQANFRRAAWAEAEEVTMSLEEFRQAVGDLDRVLAEAERDGMSPRSTGAALTITANVARARMQRRAPPRPSGQYDPAAVWAQIRSANA